VAGALAVKYFTKRGIEAGLNALPIPLKFAVVLKMISII
jgi:hypothetical protein